METGARPLNREGIAPWREFDAGDPKRVEGVLVDGDVRLRRHGGLTSCQTIARRPTARRAALGAGPACASNGRRRSARPNGCRRIVALPVYRVAPLLGPLRLQRRSTRQIIPKKIELINTGDRHEDRGSLAVPMSAFERRRQRALAKWMLGISRPGPGVVRGDFSDRLVARAVVLSTLDDPALNAYKIAELTGLPRRLLPTAGGPDSEWRARASTPRCTPHLGGLIVLDGYTFSRFQHSGRSLAASCQSSTPACARVRHRQNYY